MTSLAAPFALVAAGSLLHALWNVLVKRHGDGDTLFVWVYSVTALPVVAAAVAVVAPGLHHGRAAWTVTVGTALVSTCLHTVYAVVLQRAYVRADLITTYPVARGLAPVLVTLVAVAWSGPPTPRQAVGLAVVLAGTALVARPRTDAARGTGNPSAGIVVAVCIAAYTLWDAWAIGVLDAHVVIYLAVASGAQAVLLTAVLWRRRGEFGPALRSHWSTAVPIAVLVPASYGLILLALRDAPPGMVSTARTLTIVFGSVLGVWLLRERPSAAAVVGTAVIVAGTVTAAG